MGGASDRSARRAVVGGRILGIDPGSLVTGWGIVESVGNSLNHVACGTIATVGAQAQGARLSRIYRGIQFKRKSDGRPQFQVVRFRKSNEVVTQHAHPLVKQSARVLLSQISIQTAFIFPIAYTRERELKSNKRFRKWMIYPLPRFQMCAG